MAFSFERNQGDAGMSIVVWNLASWETGLWKGDEGAGLRFSDQEMLGWRPYETRK